MTRALLEKVMDDNHLDAVVYPLSPWVGRTPTSAAFSKDEQDQSFRDES
jgi:hypothetical protein